jgi:ferric-dicitrate binding protein FerR (iron transport regulator)
MLSDSVLVTLAASSKLGIEGFTVGASDSGSLKVAYGRVLLTIGTTKRLQVKVSAGDLSAVITNGSVAIVVESGKTQVIVFSGSVEISAYGKVVSAPKPGEGVDVAQGSAGSPYGVAAASLRALKSSLTLDESPTPLIAQSLETDLPGFIGPKSGHRRWRGVSEGFGEGMHLVPPFTQTPRSAIAP